MTNDQYHKIAAAVRSDTLAHGTAALLKIKEAYDIVELTEQAIVGRYNIEYRDGSLVFVGIPETEQAADARQMNLFDFHFGQNVVGREIL